MMTKNLRNCLIHDFCLRNFSIEVVPTEMGGGGVQKWLYPRKVSGAKSSTVAWLNLFFGS